jgi:hypothetical protein
MTTMPKQKQSWENKQKIKLLQPAKITQLPKINNVQTQIRACKNRSYVSMLLNQNDIVTVVGYFSQQVNNAHQSYCY